MNELEKKIINETTENLMDISFACSCGRRHTVPIKKLIIKKGAIQEVRPTLDKLGIQGKAGIIYDKKIEQTVVSPVLAQLKKQGIDFLTHSFGDGSSVIYPEIANAEKIAHTLESQADYLISIGSGVISDLTKYAGTLLTIPSILIATAPSMNGYASLMAALTEEHVKKTVPIKNLTAIFADIEIIKEAPVKMVRSGLGDIVSRAVCIADWKLASLIKDSYFCDLPFHLTDVTEQQYIQNAEAIGKRRPSGIHALTDGIMRSGLTMTLIGTSTPSSGSEHVISHYWDLMALIANRPKLFHGVQVGVATPIALRLYDFVAHYPIKKYIDFTVLRKNYPSKDDLHDFMLKKFGAYGKGVYEVFKAKYLDWNKKKKELEYVIDNWQEIWSTLFHYLRPREPVEQTLQQSGAAFHYRTIGKNRDDVVDAILNGWLIRSRYTLLDLAHDLGISHEAAEKIIG